MPRFESVRRRRFSGPPHELRSSLLIVEFADFPSEIEHCVKLPVIYIARTSCTVKVP